MAFCTKCGATLDPNSQFCASCGAPIDSAQPSSSGFGSQPASSAPPTWSSSPPPSPPPVYGGQTTTQMSRPTGVTILAVLGILGGILLLIFAAIVGAIVNSIFPGMGAGLAILFVIFALIQFGIAYGFWVGATWAWWLGMIGGVLDIISIVGGNVPGLIIGIIMLYYLTRPHVKMWFHKG